MMRLKQSEKMDIFVHGGSVSKIWKAETLSFSIGLLFPFDTYKAIKR